MEHTDNVIDLIPRTADSPIVVINNDKSFWYGRFGMVVASQADRVCVEIPTDDAEAFVWFKNDAIIGIGNITDAFEKQMEFGDFQLDDEMLGLRRRPNDEEERKECPDHLRHCDDDGYCMFCGEQE
jgi:hypothetical protein